MKRQSQFSSPSSSKKKHPPPTSYCSSSASQEKPVTIFNPLPPRPRNGRLGKKERIFLHHRNPRVQPRILYVKDDGESETRKTASPCFDDVLVLVGQSQEKVCFHNLSKKKFCIWDLEKEKMENEVECGEGIQGAHGFGHTTSGQLKIVRLFSPPIVPNEPTSITKPLKYCVEICKLDEKDEKKKKNLLWSKKEVHSQVPYEPSEEDFAKLVSEDGMLFWKGGSARQVQIIQFDLENEELGLLVPPPMEELSVSNMSLGHGFQGQLSLSLSTPPSKNEKYFRLHIWVLQRNEGGGFWHKLLNIPMEDSFISSYVPLSFFHGRGDGAVNLLFQRNEEEIVQIIPGGVETVSGTIVSRFSFSESSFAIAMESCKFKATPLAAQTYIILEHNNQTREREVEEHKEKKWDSSRLSFADDFD